MLRLTDAFNQLVLGRSKARRLVQTIAIGTVTRVPVGRRFIAGRLSEIGIGYPRDSRGDDRMVGTADARRRLRRHAALRVAA